MTVIHDKYSKHRPGGFAVLALVVATSVLASCVSETEAVQSKEDNLLAAGFVATPANTAARKAMLSRLPANTFLMRTKGNNVNYVYADPVNCDCLYVGSQKAYGRYRANRQLQRVADKQLLTAQTYADASWNWGAWGPGYFEDFDGPFGPGSGW